MRDLRMILCPVDFSEATAFGLNVAGSVAERLDADLHLLHVLPGQRMAPELPVDAEHAYERWEQESTERLAALAGELRSEGHRVRAEVRRGTPFEQVIEAVARTDAGLVVMPTHGRAALDRLFYGSVAERVLRTARCPVLTVPPTLEGMGEFAPRRVLMAADLSASDGPALDVAVDFARAFAAEVVIGHVFTYAHVSDDGPDWWWPTLTRDQVAEAVEKSTARLEVLADRVHKHGIDVATVLSQGANPALEIVRMVEEEEGDLVVAGAGSGNLLRRALLGRTTEKLLRTCPRPLMTVPCPEAEQTGEGTPALVPA